MGLDIENLERSSMSLADAELFVEYIQSTFFINTMSLLLPPRERISRGPDQS
jgi:hypothetical protein